MNRADILAKLLDLPVSTWRYDAELGTPLHVGPMAQDFFAAFELGGSDKTIFLLDYCGVLLAGLQALAARVAELEAKVDPWITTSNGSGPNSMPSNRPSER